MVGTTVSHYKIVSKLGEGGMGVVYKAYDTRLERDVALKFLPSYLTCDSEARERFVHEARAASTLQHSNICVVHDIDESADGQTFIAMEYLDGETLNKKIGRSPLKLEEALQITIQVARGLAKAHEHGITHRDVKPANIMVTTDGVAKIVDFGLAKLSGRTMLTRAGSTLGTAAYMSPEQARGDPVDQRTDIWSLGVVLYEMLTGHLPFRGEHEAALLYTIINEEPMPLEHYLAEAPTGLLQILDRTLKKDRNERYQTLQEMMIDLLRLTNGRSEASHLPPQGAVISPERRTPGTTEGMKRIRRLFGTPFWIAVGSVVAIAVVAIAVLLQRKPGVRLNPNATSSAVTIPFRNILYPALSADGKIMAFSAQGEDGTYDIYMMNTASGSSPRRVTQERSRDAMWDCDISPDLSKIAYDLGGAKVKVIASEGGQPRTVADTGAQPQFTLDGTRIGYFRVIPSGFEIWSIRPDGTDRRRELLDTAYVWLGALSWCWSPDGKSVAWIRNFRGGYEEVMVRELGTGREWQLTHDKKRVDEVRWATNGQIIFTSQRSGRANLWMIPAEGGEPAPVTRGTTPIVGARISADTKKILYEQRELTQQLWISSINGDGARQMTFEDVMVLWASFAPDGRSLAVLSSPVNGAGVDFEEERSLYVMDREGKDRRVLLTRAGLAGPSWSPGGTWLMFPDSGNIYLIAPANPGVPRFLCQGRFIHWMGDEDLSVWRGMKSYQYSLQEGLVGQLTSDSLLVYAHKGTSRIVYQDYREGHKGWWTGLLDSLGSSPVNPRRLRALDSRESWDGRLPLTVSSDMRFVVFQTGLKAGDPIFMLSLSDGKVKRIGTVPASGMSVIDITRDEKDMLWIREDLRAKLSMIENPFE